MKALTACLAAVLVLFGSASRGATSEATPPPAASQKLTFYHWWTSPAEASALQALTTLFHQKYPNVTISALPAPPGAKVRALFSLIQRLSSEKQPPDAFQMNAGYGAQVFFDAGLLSPIDDLWAAEKLEAVIPAMIRDVNKFDGHYYSVPSNLHRMNVIWYNKVLLDKHNIDASTLTTWPALFKAAKTLKAAGIEAPIQVAIRTPAYVFEAAMAEQGIGVYEDWINGKIVALDDPRQLKALTVVQGYMAYANADSATLVWDAAVARVISGQSAFCMMGDWANAEFRVAGKKYGKDYGTLVAPGTAGMFAVNVDSFQHPRGLADPTNSDHWLRLLISREGQDAFNPLKGSISARTDADISRYDPYQRTAIADLRSAKSIYPTLGMAVPEAFTSRLHEILAEFNADGNTQKALAAMADSATRLKGKYSRTWSLK